ncbi:phage baseplate protein [Pectobacterium actinidiae]|uniref:phage baseplate protein n=1 Tax=Pectobacterium actinidiae TaxID=1507808 RepID=UPI004040BF50
MSIVGIFNKTRPQISGLFFDAILEESTELRTDVSEYPLENAITANDNAVVRPLYVTMTVALSDNPVKTLMAEAGQYSTIAGIGAGVGVGVVGSVLGGGAAALVGVAASIGLATVPSGDKRSQTVLAAIREIQTGTPDKPGNQIIDVIGTKAAYKNMIITNTRTVTNKENEGGLELVVEMRQLVLIDRNHDAETINANLPAGDTAATQGQATIHRGEVTPQ